jgi:hypothetical protein
VQFCAASLLATLILDDAAMELIRERREAPVLFEAALQLLSESVERIRRAARAGPGLPAADRAPGASSGLLLGDCC